MKTLLQVAALFGMIGFVGCSEPEDDNIPNVVPGQFDPSDQDVEVVVPDNDPTIDQDTLDSYKQMQEKRDSPDTEPPTDGPEAGGTDAEVVEEVPSDGDQ